jgi:peptide/nickel transport system substrate-binding protein
VIREWATLQKDVQRKEFAAFMTGLTFEPTYNPRDLFHTDAIDGENNWISFSNPTVDSLIDLGLATPERERARPVWVALQRLLAEEQPYTWLFLRRERVGVSRRIHGLEEGSAGDPRVFGHWPTFGIRHWWIES